MHSSSISPEWYEAQAELAAQELDFDLHLAACGVKHKFPLPRGAATAPLSCLVAIKTMELTEALEISLKECRYDFVCNTTAQVMIFLEKQGFTFDEIVDGLMNYAWVNTNSIDAVCFLMQASLSLRKTKETNEHD